MIGLMTKLLLVESPKILFGTLQMENLLNVFLKILLGLKSIAEIIMTLMASKSALLLRTHGGKP